MTLTGSGVRCWGGSGRAALALLLAAGLSACGGDGGQVTDGGGPRAEQESPAEQEPPAAAGAEDPCGLLTTEEVASAGIEATDPQPVETATGQGCTYGDDPLEAVQVLVQRGGGQTYFDQSEDLLSAPEPLPGLGDEAVLDASDPQQVTVLVLQEGTVLLLGGSITAEDARSLAEKALGRLGG